MGNAVLRAAPSTLLRTGAPPRETAVRHDLKLLIDSFAGGGGASTGIEAAVGRPVDYAINHNEAAIIMHRANHPRTVHLQESVWKAKPAERVHNAG